MRGAEKNSAPLIDADDNGGASSAPRVTSVTLDPWEIAPVSDVSVR